MADTTNVDDAARVTADDDQMKNDDQREQADGENQNDDGQGTGDDGDTEANDTDGAPAKKAGDAESGAAGDADTNDGDNDDDEDSDDGEDLNEDDDRLDVKVRRQLKAKNRENKRLRERATAAELKALKYEVAEKAGLPLNVAKRLTGATEDELIDDAASLIEDFGLQGRVSPSNLPNNGDEGRAGRRGNVADDLDTVAGRIYERNN